MYYNTLRQMMAKIKLQEEGMKILNDLRLNIEKPIWALEKVRFNRDKGHHSYYTYYNLN